MTHENIQNTVIDIRPVLTHLTRTIISVNFWTCKVEFKHHIVACLIVCRDPYDRSLSDRSRVTDDPNLDHQQTITQRTPLAISRRTDRGTREPPGNLQRTPSEPPANITARSPVRAEPQGIGSLPRREAKTNLRNFGDHKFIPT